MAEKPALENTRWATDETNNTAPSSGQRDTGWVSGQTAVSSYFNELAFNYHGWFTLLDGIITSNPNFTVDETCIELPANGFISLSGVDGRVYHETYTKTVGIGGGTVVNGTDWIVNANMYWQDPSGGTNQLLFGIPIEVDERLEEVRVKVRTTNTGGLTAALHLNDAAGNIIATVSDTSTSGGGAVDETLTLTVPDPDEMLPANSYCLMITSTVTGTRVYMLEIDYSCVLD